MVGGRVQYQELFHCLSGSAKDNLISVFNARNWYNRDAVAGGIN